MAQNEIKKYYTDKDLYNDLRQPLNNFYDLHNRLEKLSNFLNSASSSDYPTIPAETLSDMASLRTEINAYLADAATISMMEKVKNFIRI